MDDARLSAPPQAPEPSSSADVLGEICGLVASAFRQAWGRGPINTSAHWAGPNILFVLLQDGHTDAEKTLRATGHSQELLQGRQVLHSSIEEELMEAVRTATGRRVVTTLSATRLEPDLSAQIFLLQKSHPDASEHPVALAAHQAMDRAEELQHETAAVQAQARQSRRRVQATRTRES